ncbi:type I-E CRISPR-associated protein Cse1/CasA [Aerococcaceae bacterium NML201209]|nr:type I-E CRISPR-associated protein Cse1/CasA [Aerococcaceae bacterium NML201209]MCW6664936.1 type I-E CRISPR-associated protein Cse1/CasA [Aerococcaceae bacterium NML191219]
MGKFNLLDEPWISVIVDDKGTSQEVSLKALFENAHLYKELAGDTKTQDFAVMRVLLAVLHTVFSRVDATGKVYEVEGRKLFELNERLKPEREMDPAHLDDYEGLLFDTWEDIWGQQKFPCIINDYLEKWRDRFNLLDEEYPFFQVTERVLKNESNITDSSGRVSGRTFNRLISQSGNKVALFAPKFLGLIGVDEVKSKELCNKDRLSYSQLTRWLITYQGYSGAEGKVKFKFCKDDSQSKGWIYEIGGIYIKSKNIFETLMLNFCLAYKEDENLQHIQTPCWECSDDEVLKRYLTSSRHNNIASLYTDWSRGIYIDPKFEENEPFSFKCAKVSAIDHHDNFLEPMTLWDKNKTGKLIPRKHEFEEAMWRSFGLMTSRMRTKESGGRRPGIMDWLSDLESERIIENGLITLEAVSMQAGKPASSSVPVNEIIDQLTLDSYVLMDDSDNGWIVRINDTIEFTQDVVDKIYRSYLNDIKRVRNLENADGFLKRNIATMYYCLDAPFREWLASIQPENDFDETILKWRSALKDLILEQAKEHLHHATIRDYTGIKMDNRVENIVTVYHKFLNSLNKKFS